MRATGVPNGLSALGYNMDDVEALTEKAWKQRRVVDNAARQVRKEEIREIFAGALRYW
jgi:alcohol dehydrogenase class IV